MISVRVNDCEKPEINIPNYTSTKKLEISRKDRTT
jgi:hypothetical protein